MTEQKCAKHPFDGEHEWTKRHDYMGDPDVINGTVSWQTAVCCWCGLEQQEIDAMTEQNHFPIASSEPHPEQKDAMVGRECMFNQEV